MGYPIHPLANAGLAGQYLNQLGADNISQRYFNKQDKYKSTFWNRFKMIWSIYGTLKELDNFYPHVPIVKSSLDCYKSEILDAVVNGFAVTAVSWFSIFNLARRGRVLPFFKQYGSFFKTHRLFRQYVFTLVMPVTLLTRLADYRFLNHTEHLWATHAKRMNQQLTSDPEESEYPEHMMPHSIIGSWQTPYAYPFDLENKRQNEVSYLLAPSREDFEVDAVEVPTGDVADEEEQDEE